MQAQRERVIYFSKRYNPDENQNTLNWKIHPIMEKDRKQTP